MTGADSKAVAQAAALTSAEFAAGMAALGPFEPAPRLAVAVSGGPDSMALCLLTADWAAARGGTVVALTVDHGLRPGSADEVRQVGIWLAAQGVPHDVLVWTGPKPDSGIQEAARAARYRLLENRCREGGTLHLLLAHHRDDQAETVLLRLAKGTGPDGLAAMPAIRELGAVRLLRPLLGVPRARLTALLAARGQSWIEDPSNRSEAFARVRLRQSAVALAREGLTPDRLADTARRCAHARAALEQASLAVMAKAVEIHPEGYLLIDPEPLRRAGRELGLRVLGRCLAAIGGSAKPIRLERLERLHAAVVATGSPGRAAVSGRTLGGCLVRPWRGRLLVAREAEAIEDRRPLIPDEPCHWDRRFLVRAAPGVPDGLTVAPLLGAARLASRRGRRDDLGKWLPAPALAALPAVWLGERLVAVPTLRYVDEDSRREGVFEGGAVATVFRPNETLGSATFAVV